MIEEVNLDGPAGDWSPAKWAKWEAVVEERYSKGDLVKKIRHMLEQKARAPKTLYTLDAVARPGCHIGLPTFRD